MISSLSYERECIRSVLFTHAASADLVGLITSAPIRFGPSLPLLHISFSRDDEGKCLSRASDTFHHNVLMLCEHGIVAVWAGAIRAWPIAAITSRQLKKA